MAENSKIEWTDHTFNPWIGCTKIADECKHCYAETLMDKRYGKVKWGPQGTRVLTSAAYWRQPLKWDRAAAKAGVRARVFCASLADVFEDSATAVQENDRGITNLYEAREYLWDLIASTPNLIWLLLTKRPQSICPSVPPMWLYSWPENVWTGTSAPGGQMVDDLLRAPGPHFLSMEPMLGPSHLTPKQLARLKWVICGGESGPNARPMHPDHARGVRDQCAAAGVPFLFKQWGEWLPGTQFSGAVADIKDNEECSRFEVKYYDEEGKLQDCDPLWLAVKEVEDEGLETLFRVGKKAAGRILDGVTHDGLPEAFNAKGAAK